MNRTHSMFFHVFKGFSASLSIEVASSSAKKAFLLFSNPLIFFLTLSSFFLKTVKQPHLFQQSHKNNQQDIRKHIIWNFALSLKRAPGCSQWEMSFPVEKQTSYLLSKALTLMSGRIWAIPTHGFPGGSAGKESACNAGDLGLIPGLGRSPGKGHDNPLQYSCLENPHGQRSLVGYSPWGRKESDMTEQLSTAQHKENIF